MKKIKNEAILQYVMADNVWKIDLPQFLEECQLCTNGNAYDVCWNLLRRILVILVERAIELNDPALNIIMYQLSLYDGSHTQTARENIIKMREFIKKSQSDSNY